VGRLAQEYPTATCALRHRSALELVVATILSAQCTDARVNQVTPALFARYRRAEDYAAADPRVLEREIQSTGFFRNKTKSIIGMAHALVEHHDGDVPDTMAALVKLRPPAVSSRRPGRTPVDLPRAGSQRLAYGSAHDAPSGRQ
jgi:endonuclease-3